MSIYNQIRKIIKLVSRVRPEEEGTNKEVPSEETTEEEKVVQPTTLNFSVNCPNCNHGFHIRL